MARNRILTATLDEQLIGFAGQHFSGQQCFDPSLRQLVHVMQWSTPVVLFMGSVLFEHPCSDTLHLDTLAVRSDARGRGIGAQLMRVLDAVAHSEDKRQITLDLEDTNSRARHLYERLGFRESGFKRLPWPWRKAFRFSGSYRRLKEIQPPSV